MQTLDNYIRNTVFLSMLLVLLALGSLDFIFTVFDEIGETTERYQTRDALKYVLSIFPRHIYELLPMTALFGALIGLGAMASSNELVIMQAAGIKVGRIVWAVMKPTAMIMVLGLGLGEFIAPPLELKGEVGKAIAHGEETVLSSTGFWDRDGNEYMHFNAIEPDGVLHGVSVYEYDQQRLLSSTFATTAVYVEDADFSHWLLQEGRKTVFTRSEEGTNSSNSSFVSTQWQVDITPDLLQVMIIDPDKMAISDLYRYAQRFNSQGQDASPYLLSFWKKILQPLATAALVLVAISFIFGPLREATMGSRVFTAICFGLGFIILQRLLNTVSLIYQFNPFLAVLVPVLLIALIGTVMLRRAT
jgi:lipopolysaccharide export system permease protein